MSTIEKMTMEPEFPENLFVQIFQEMEKIDLINSEFGGLALIEKLLLGLFVLILLAAITFGIYYAYNNWDKIKKKAKKLTADIKGQLTASKKKAN